MIPGEALCRYRPGHQRAGLVHPCAVAHPTLTEPLGWAELRGTIVAMESGDGTTPHRHAARAKVSITPTGGTVDIDGDRYAGPDHGAVRVGHDLPLRRVRTTDEETQSR